VQVESHGTHAGPVERPDLLVGDCGRELGDADEGGPEPLERVNEVGLVERLERAGDDGAAADAEGGGGLPVVVDREGRRNVPAICDQREAWIDDVQVAVEKQP
jgi:hypothetical protein